MLVALLIASILVVPACTAYALRRLYGLIQRVYDAGRVTGYAEGVLEQHRS